MLVQTKTVAVIGSGVVGLTSAYRLLEASYGVTIFAHAFPPATTSDVAAAYWSPSALGDDARAREWAWDSLAMFQQLTAVPGSGINILDFDKLYDEPVAMPEVQYLDGVQEIAPERFPGTWYGYHTTVPRIDVPIYMPWLMGRVEAMGATIQPYIVQSFHEIPRNFNLIVNATGLGARLLAHDNVYPVRGQVISVRKPAEFPDLILSVDAGAETTYIISRSQDCLLGGTYQYYNGDTEVDPATGNAILARCARFYPTLADTEIFQHKVGLRPGRDTVRLESEQLSSGQLVIHNYGHGSIGHTLSWGCAADLLRRVQEYL
ncbi:MAG: FAD-dependent oxidoreductase [Caldilineaceae bacterium]|nr:FAD-dependent oxidoreductase [Caldilineaceae bacterium]